VGEPAGDGLDADTADASLLIAVEELELLEG